MSSPIASCMAAATVSPGAVSTPARSPIELSRRAVGTGTVSPGAVWARTAALPDGRWAFARSLRRRGRQWILIPGNTVLAGRLFIAAAGLTLLAPSQAHQGRITLVRCGQGWTGPLGPRSRRIDCMIANVVVQVKISMSAPPSTPVYFAMTGAAACSVTASRWALTAAHTFSP